MTHIRLFRDGQATEIGGNSGSAEKQDFRQKLFNHMSEQHGLSLLESEMDDIIYIINPPKYPEQIWPEQQGDKAAIIEPILNQIANYLKVAVDFSDKSYDGDKAAPMDQYGFIEYLFQSLKQKDEEINKKATEYLALSMKYSIESNKYDQQIASLQSTISELRLSCSNYLADRESRDKVIESQKEELEAAKNGRESYKN